jgi:HlyD family secretion protein
MKTTTKLALTCLAGLFAVSGCNRMGSGGALPSTSEEQTAVVEVGPLTATVGATGTVRPQQLQELTFKTSGTVDRVLVEVGDTVRPGGLLAVLDDETLPATVLLARADLVAAERALEEILHSRQEAAQAELAVANARDVLEDAQRKYTWNQEGNRATSDTLKSAKAKLAIERERMERAESLYRRARGDLSDGGEKSEAFVAYNNARIAYNRALSSYNWYTGHPSEIEQAQLAADVALAQAQLDDAIREFERVRNGPNPDDVAAAQARVAAAKATSQQARIEAPFFGTITDVEVQPGDQVAPGTVGFQLADLSRLLVDVDVSEVDINRVKPGQTAELTFDAILDRTYRGTVTEVDLVGEETQGVVNFRVTVALDEPDELVRPGLTAAVTLVVDQIEDALLVPNRAVRVVDGERVVYVLRDGVLTPVPIVLGTSSETSSEVVEGDLEVGDLIVLNPPILMEPGDGPPGGSFLQP